jgi:hypothetical protein
VGQRKTRSFDDIADRDRNTAQEPSGDTQYWPRPVRDREWIDADGTAWRMRGGQLHAMQARRLMKRSDVHVVRAYGMEVGEVLGAARDALLARVDDFLAGKAPTHTEFKLGDFRDPNHRVVLMVQESC